MKEYFCAYTYVDDSGCVMAGFGFVGSKSDSGSEISGKVLADLSEKLGVDRRKITLTAFNPTGLSGE